MSSSASTSEVPDAVVYAIRRTSKAFLALQSSRYASPGLGASSVAPAHTANGATSTRAVVMHTKNPPPSHHHHQGATSPLREGHSDTPSTWSEIYRSGVQDIPDAPAQRLWGLVSVVLSLLEQGGGAAADSVNASAALVAWNDRFAAPLAGVEELLSSLHASHPLRMEDGAVEEVGSAVLGRLETAFLSGHFEVAAALLDALLLFLRRGRSPVLSADVETALADVKRLLTVGFHDGDSYETYWVPSANHLVSEWRYTLSYGATAGEGGNVNSSSGIEDLSAVDALVWDLCATCRDVLLLITSDATLLVQRCLESRRSATDFLVATCAIMTPYAPLADVASIFARYVPQWATATTEDTWFNTSVLAILECATLADVVGAMATVVKTVAAPHRSRSGPTDPPAGTDASDLDDEDDNASVISDTVSVSEIEQHTAVVTPAYARRFIMACMTAHVADLCAPVGVASSAADIGLTFTRNNLVSAYAELFAFHARTWRVAGLYACYSPLINPRFLVDVVESVAPLAAEDEVTYQSLCAFLRTSWSPHSALQTAVRARLSAVLPGNATIEMWCTAVDVCYTDAARSVHRYIIATHWNGGRWARAAWLAVETGLTNPLQSHLRQIVSHPHALASPELYAVGAAVHHGFMGFDTSRAPELTCYLCAAAAVAAYRQAATAADAAQRGAPSSSGDAPSREDVVRAVVSCLQAVETALTCADACEVMLHPSVTFTLVEHGAALLLSLRQLLRDPTTGDSSGSMHVSGTVLPLLVEAYQLSSTHFALSDPSLPDRSQALAETLAHVHQTCL